MRLENKVAVITGGSSGIGRAVAERFIKEGAKVVIADINEVRLAETAKEVREAGGTIETIRTDVRSEEDNKQMIKFAIEKFGQLDILFCNAGIIDGFRTVGNMTNEIWDRTFDINVKGPMMQMREAINFYLENGSGNIIVTASAAGYTASKHAVIGLAQNAAYTYADRNIRVNVIVPGGVESNIMETSANIDQEGSKIFQKGMVVMPRLGKPDDFSEVAVFLANDESSFVNGAVIPVDGGWTAY